MTVRWGERYVSVTVSVAGGRCVDDCDWCTLRCSDGKNGGKTSACFAHRLVFHTTTEEMSSITVPFLRCGFADDDALLAVTSEENIRLLRDALGGDLDSVEDAEAIGRYCGPTRTPVSGMPDLSYSGPGEPAVENHRGELPESAGLAHVFYFGHHDLSKLRHLVAECAYRAGTKVQQIAELVFLMHEVAFTVVEQLGGRAGLRIWRSGDHFACQVTSRAVSSGGPFTDYTRAANYLLGGVRMLRSGPARRPGRRSPGPAGAWPVTPGRGSDGGGCSNGRVGWDWSA
jgi:hypothetical protein